MFILFYVSLISLPEIHPGPYVKELLWSRLCLEKNLTGTVKKERLPGVQLSFFSLHGQMCIVLLVTIKNWFVILFVQKLLLAQSKILHNHSIASTFVSNIFVTDVKKRDKEEVP